jgi:hypothetical protein
MYEHHHHPLLSATQFAVRVVFHLLAVTGAVAVALLAGILGYHYLADLPWIDSLLNASMILGGMGPTDPLRTTGAKLFASAYALFSGLFFIAILGFLLAPFIHRLMHRFHLEDEEPGEHPVRPGEQQKRRRT